MHDQSDWMIYGANGYTGRLIAREAVARGLRPVLAGRSVRGVKELAEELGLLHRIFSLDEGAQVAGHLEGVRLVLHCAGPFSATARPMMEGCIAAGVHYLDITGEIEVIELGAKLHERAQKAGVLLMPAVGFDVVPTDCLAAALHEQLPEAVQLELAFAGFSGLSPGTAKTMVENLPTGGRARINGVIQQVPFAWREQEIPYPDRPRWSITIPWGDVASAYHTTGIPNICVFTAMPRGRVRQARRMQRIMPLLKFGPAMKLVKKLVQWRVAGPSQEELQASRAYLWGRVTAADGRTVQGTLQTPGGYPLTVLTALEVAGRVLRGEAPEGFHTPAGAFGSGLIQAIPETNLQVPQEASPSVA